jgi:sRNA-binding carbon storage regulator CsrA
MLCLGRKVGERIICDRHGERFLEIVILRASDGKVRLGITGDKHVRIMRVELLERDGMDSDDQPTPQPAPAEAACEEGSSGPPLSPLSMPVPAWYADLPSISGD